MTVDNSGVSFGNKSKNDIRFVPQGHSNCQLFIVNCRFVCSANSIFPERPTKRGRHRFAESWNNYFLPALLLNKNEMKTVPIMIAQLRAADYSKFDLGKVYMFILLAILPVLTVYVFLSRFIIKGVTAGSVKG